MRSLVLMLVGALAGSSALGGTLDSWPAPRYPVRVDDNVMVRMRDDIRLATDVYMPSGEGEKLPSILIRTPYSKDTFEMPGAMSASSPDRATSWQCRTFAASIDQRAYTRCLPET